MASPVRPDSAYALAQLEAAAAALAAAGDASARAKAGVRLARWRAVVEGMRDGRLDVGSRTPVQGVPAWATLEVAPGGFATGHLLAGGPPTDAERALEGPHLPPGRGLRDQLNRWYLGADGRAELLRLLRSGCYRIDVPEEAALAAVAWLWEKGEVLPAVELVEELGNWLHLLRFFPTPAPTPARWTGRVCRVPAATIAAELRAREVPVELRRMNETLSVWQPLTDRFLDLFLETVEGEPPRVEQAPDGSPLRDERGVERLAGGWPGRRWPEGWLGRAQGLLDELARLRAAHPHARRPDDPKSNLGRLVHAARAAVELGGAPGPRELGWVRRVLAITTHRRGAPGSPGHAALRLRQAADVALPPHAALAQVLAARLDAVPAGAGVLDPAAFLTPVAPGTPLPPALGRRLDRCVELSPAELLERGFVPSAEVFAELLPPLTAHTVAACLPEPEVAQLYEATYAAFRRRRTLLLLNYGRPVRFGDLPWVAALARGAVVSGASLAGARQALQEAARLCLRHFPHTLTPNPLVSELAALSTAAGLTLPWVEELAADIFMGGFSPKFRAAAEHAQALLRGTLYDRYYDLPAELPAAAVPPRAGEPPARPPAPRVDPFADCCAERAAEVGGPANVARNGAVIEQAQILTTHNLALLLGLLPPADRGSAALEPLARRCLAEVFRILQAPPPGHKRVLSPLKNAAYTWRQMLVFASLLDDDALAALVVEAEARVVKAPPGLARGMGPAVRGLRLVAEGGRFDAQGRGPGGARRFLGWAPLGHWVAAEALAG